MRFCPHWWLPQAMGLPDWANCTDAFGGFRWIPRCNLGIVVSKTDRMKPAHGFSRNRSVKFIAHEYAPPIGFRWALRAEVEAALGLPAGGGGLAMQPRRLYYQKDNTFDCGWGNGAHLLFADSVRTGTRAGCIGGCLSAIGCEGTISIYLSAFVLETIVPLDSFGGIVVVPD